MTVNADGTGHVPILLWHRLKESKAAINLTFLSPEPRLIIYDSSGSTHPSTRTDHDGLGHGVNSAVHAELFTQLDEKHAEVSATQVQCQEPPVFCGEVRESVAS